MKISKILRACFVAFVALSSRWVSSSYAATAFNSTVPFQVSLFDTTPPARDLLTSELLCFAGLSTFTASSPYLRTAPKSVRVLAGGAYFYVSVGEQDTFFMEAATGKVLSMTHD